MCTKTKTSFGCGHCIKTLADCDTPRCTTIEKWGILKDIDCPQCKIAGPGLTRGLNGRGRYGREMTRTRDRRRSPLRSASPEVVTPSSASSRHQAVSPWAPTHRARCLEKEWDTPTRQQADDAWLAEHLRRMCDLEEKTSKMSLKSKHSRRSSPVSSYERLIELDEVEEPEELEEPRTPTRHKSFHTQSSECEISEDSELYYPTHRHRDRKVSHTSSGSMPHYQESPRARATPRKTKTYHVPAVSEVALQEINDAKHRYRPRRTKTEPYFSQSHCFNTPITSPMLANGPWIPQYEMIQPLHHEHYYPRTYPVY